MQQYTTTIRPGYIQVRSLYLGANALSDPNKRIGRVSVLLKGDDQFSIEGSLNPQGYLTGMAKLYRHLDLKDGSVVSFSITTDGNLLINSPAPSVAAGTSLPPKSAATTVFARMQLKHIHIEPFRPENLNIWEPENETDVYLAFGVLQDFTDYQYCCAASQSLLNRLGAQYSATAKPDAILIDRTDDQYLMAEWKKFSSDFKANHKPNEVDVLVCWLDDETDRTVLPPNILALQSVARKAAQTALSEDIG
jgi:hypothetical protein